MHHNVDKALLVGGRAEPVFGGGEVIEPIQIYLVGRAILEKDGKGTWRRAGVCSKCS
jgi:S-adenosylmethionine synthetase